MSSYYYSDDDDVVLVRQESPDGHGFRARSTSTRGKEATSRYGGWEQSELEKRMFSWSLQDVLNKNLLKKRVTISAVSAFPSISLHVFSRTTYA
jgi:senataxin